MNEWLVATKRAKLISGKKTNGGKTGIGSHTDRRRNDKSKVIAN
jgi:hypothetical protein